MSTVSREYGIRYAMPGCGLGVYASNFASRADAAAYVRERVRAENPQIVTRMSSAARRAADRIGATEWEEVNG